MKSDNDMIRRWDAMKADDLEKAIRQAIFDPGAAEGYKADRSLTQWQADAVMRVVTSRLGALEPQPVQPAPDAPTVGQRLIQGAKEALAHANGELPSVTVHHFHTPDAQAIREAALREAADRVDPKYPRPCDCDRCDCGNSGDFQAVTSWDEAKSNADAILALIGEGK